MASFASYDTETIRSCDEFEGCFLSKAEALEEIKWSLTTFVSKLLFSMSPDGAICFNEKCQVTGFTQGCIKSILEPISIAASSRVRLDQFVMSSDLALPVQKMIRGWLSTYLVQWKERVSNLELESFLRFMSSLKPLMDEFKIVYAILDPVISKRKADPSLADYFSTICFEAVENAWNVFPWDDPRHVLIRSLFALSMNDLIGEITRWISGKSLHWTTRNNNRLVNNLDAFIEVLDDDKFVYKSRETSNPLFSGIIPDLIAARKSVLILRRLYNMTTSSTNPLLSDWVKGDQVALFDLFASVENSSEKSVPFVHLFRDRLHDEIKSHCSNAKKVLVCSIFENLQFGKLMKELQGIVTTVKLDDVPYELVEDNDAKTMYLRRYIDNVNTNFKPSGMPLFRWRFFFLGDESGRHVRGFRLRCDIPWPLNLIITDSHVNSYGKMLRFFLELECARQRLARLQFYYLATAAPLGTRLSIQRFDLFVFLNKIMAAILYEFSSKFDVDGLKASSSIDDLCERHDKMVAKFLNIVLADYRSAAWAKFMRYLKELSMKVVQAWTRPNVRDADLVEYRLAFESCQRFFNEFLSKKYPEFI